MAKYDLTGSLDPTFSFSISGREFEFRKPTVREMRNISKVFSAVEAEADPDAQVEANERAMKELYAFVRPLGHDSDIAEMMETQPVDVQIAFNEMLSKEFNKG